MSVLQFALSVAQTQQATTPTTKNLVALDPIENLSVPFNTSFATIPFITQTNAIFDDGSNQLVDIEWLEGSYNGTVSDDYNLVGNIIIPAEGGFKNDDDLQATVTVTVLVQEHSLFFESASSELVGFGTHADVQFLHTDPFTISFWFKVPANPVSTNDVILGTFNTSSQNRGWEVMMTTGGLITVELRNTPTTNRFFVTTTTDFADNQWHHFLFVKNATVANSNLWIDGIDVAVTTGNNLSASLSTTDPITLGGRQTGSNYWDGYIDKIAIWDTDEAANVQDIFNSFHPLSLDSPPIHYWEFDGSSYADTGTSANKLNGTPVNSPTFSTDVPVDEGDESFQYRIEEGDKDNVSEESGFFQWGGSVVEHEGTYYMLGNKWVNTDGFNGWVHDNRIYVGSSANKLGPFSLVTEISILRSQAWAANMVTNPYLMKDGSNFILYYVGTNYTVRSYPVVSSQARNNQKIGAAIATHPAGPWTPSTNNPILSPSASDWDQNLVNNPVGYKDSNGDINLVYKSDLNGTPNDLRLGRVKLTTWEGPVTDRSTASPNFGLDVFAEDPTIWEEDGRHWAIFKAMDSEVVPVGHGILAVSDDGGATFRLALGEHAYSLTINWNDATSNNYSKIERPFVLVESGVATALFTAVLRTNNTSFNVGRDISARV